MSTTYNQTAWTFNLTTSNSYGYDQINWNAYAQNGMTDEWANAIYQALKDITPPEGCELQISVSKQNVVDTVYDTNADVSPITFS